MGLEPLDRVRREPWPEIPGYRIEGVVGRGSTGVVYRARQLAVDRAVALKVLHAELAGRGNAIRRLQREARTTARLAHPSIVSAIDMGETRGQWWYAMELVDGEPLSQRMRTKGKLSEREALRLFIPLCEALQHAHEQGVVHRDIKPANILVDIEGRPHLVDLGLALAEDDPAITRHGGTLGTPHYISPEQARDPTSADIRSDIWSLGATLYHAVCGRPPFDGTSVAEILSGVLYARIVDPQELAPNLSRGTSLVLRKCLSRAPDRRYQAPREMLEDLELLRERREVQIRASSLDPVATEGRPWVRVWLAVGTAALIIGAAVIAALHDDQRPIDGSDANSARSLEPWPELERVYTKGQAALASLAPAITELDQLKPVPDRFRARYDTVVMDLVGRYHTAVDEFAKSFNGEVERALTARDYLHARELVSASTLEATLHERFAPSSKQLDDLHERLRDRELAKRVDAAIDSELERDLAALRAKLETRVLPEVANLRERGAWKSARAALDAALAEGLAERASEARRMPDDYAARLGERARAVYAPHFDELDRAWSELDRTLADIVTDRADALEAAVRARSYEGDPVAELNRVYSAALADHHWIAGEALSAVSALAATAFDARVKSVAAAKEGTDEEDAQTWAFTTEREVADAWKERRYPLVRERWAMGEGEPWIGKIAERTQVETQWAQLLEELLERAAASVKAQNGRRMTLLLGTIQSDGTINAGSDPLENGFGFRSSGSNRDTLLSLRALPGSKAALLGAEAVERLAGIAPSSADIVDPKDRLLRTLFRYRESDVTSAVQAFRSGPLPRDQYPALIADLDRRLTQSATAFAEEKNQRVAEARQRYNLIQRTRKESNAAKLTAQRIDALLKDFSDLDWIAQRRAELEGWRAALDGSKSAPATTVERFDAPLDVLEGRGRFAFEFGSDPAKGWDSGDWVRDRDGWRAPDQRAQSDILALERWPRAALATTFDLDAKLDVRFDVEQPASSGPPRLVMFSVAGWHVLVAGPKQTGERGHWKATSGDNAALSAAINDVLAGRGRELDALKADAVHVFRITLSQKRGRIELELDGKSLGTQDGVRPTESEGWIALRSLEIVGLKRVRIEGLLR